MTQPAGNVGDGSVRVFEAVNERLKEFYVGTVADRVTILELEQAHKTTPPAAIAHWRAEHAVSYRFVDGRLPRPEGLAVLRSYALVVSRIGWTVITD